MQSEINQMKITRPAVGKYYENFLLKKNEIDEVIEDKTDYSHLVKIYPGSSKGPLPEDDPEHYSDWFMRNQPTEEIYGKNVIPDFKDIGVKWKYIYQNKQLDEDAMQIQYMDDV